ncbi:MAG: DOMON domain-containing protein [Armatimonadota bacterium]
MNRWMMLLLLPLLMHSAMAAPVTAIPTQYLIFKPRTPLVIDGKLNEWDMAHTPYVISAFSNNPLNQGMTDPSNKINGDADASGRAALAWNEQFLYVAGEMTDDQLTGVKPDSAGNQGPPGWGCDSLMMVVASYRQPLKPNSPYHPYAFISVRYAPSGNSRGKLAGNEAALNKRDMYWKLPAGSKWAVTDTARGYNVEAAIPWKALNFVARPGERLFMAFLQADVDPGRPLSQIGWGFHEIPKDCPAFRLADRADMLGMLTVSADEVTLRAPWSVRAELDAYAGSAKITELRVLDARGKVVLAQPVSLAVPKGGAGGMVHAFPAKSLPRAGNYVVEQWAAVGSSPAVPIARIPLKVVEPAAAAPSIVNPAGELHRMGPDRIVHNAWMEHAEGFFRHNFVKGKADYLPYIRKHVEPGLKSDARVCIQSKATWGWAKALQCMALYKITGDAEYATLARDIIDYSLDAGDLGWFKVTGLAQYRYMSWLNDPNSPFAPKDAEKRYRANLCKVAANPPTFLFGESGTHNRVWHSYMLQKIARMVAEQDKQPVDPRVIAYTDYHDKLIGEVGDADDASANYHWVFFDAAVGIYFHTGKLAEFASHKGYLRTLSRYVEMVSPSGACPQFGSGNGWHMVGESLWAYELMAAQTRNGRYRWTAHRIAEYWYNHLDDRANQYHLPYDDARNNLCLGYLLADDSVMPVEPPTASRVTWRHPLAPVPIERLRERPGTWYLEMDGKHWVPDKIVLSSGNDARGLWGLVELLPVGGHTGELPGNIITLMQHDAALLAGQGYYEMTPPFQNLMWIEDLDGLPADPRTMTTDVPLFIDDPAFTFARIRTTAYQHLPVTYTRDLFFAKNGFLLVKDRVKFDTVMKVRLGPCWQTRDLGPQCGPNWFNTYYDQLYYTGLGLMNNGLQAIRNPAWDLLVFFTPRPERKHTVLDRYAENPSRCSPVQLRQVWAGMTRPGQEFTFTTVLLPHAPTLTPKNLLAPPEGSKDPKRLEVIHDTDRVTVVKAITQVDPTRPTATEMWVMLNETGGTVATGPLESDGLLTVVGHLPNGTIQHRVVAGGTLLRYRGADETAKARRLLLTPLRMPEELMK